MTRPESRMIGAPIVRREDPALLTGRGRYTADIALTDPLHIAFLRSPVAAGRITGIDTDAARAAPGVVAVLTGADLPPTAPPDVQPVLEIEVPPICDSVELQLRTRLGALVETVMERRTR